MDFREICYWGLLREFVEKIQIWLQTCKSIWHYSWRPKHVVLFPATINAIKRLFKFRNGPILDQAILFRRLSKKKKKKKKKILTNWATTSVSEVLYSVEEVYIIIILLSRYEKLEETEVMWDETELIAWLTVVMMGCSNGGTCGGRQLKCWTVFRTESFITKISLGREKGTGETKNIGMVFRETFCKWKLRLVQWLVREHFCRISWMSADWCSGL